MSTNQKQFTRRLLFTGVQIQKAANVIGAQVCSTIGKRLVYMTPIDTGQAKSNWRASRSKPHSTTRKAYVKGRYGGSTGPDVKDTTEQNKAAAIQQIVEQCRLRKNNQPMYLTNNLPYIGILESSYTDPFKRGPHKRRPKPAPNPMYVPGFVKSALDMGRQYIRNTRMIKKALSRQGIRNVSVEVS